LSISLVARQFGDFNMSVPRLPITSRGLARTEARNQMPTMLLFATVLIDRKLGAQSFETLRCGSQIRNGKLREHSLLCSKEV
jgi:hypothetical protein